MYRDICPNCEKEFTYTTFRLSPRRCQFCVNDISQFTSKKYAGIELNENEITALKDLEAVLFEPIPALNSDNNEFGFIVENKKITTLNLINKKLFYIPSSILNLSSLEVLNLSSNYIVFLPEAIKYLLSLKQLNISNNNLIILPDLINELKNLKTLNVSSNKISKLPVSLPVSLTYLDLRFNNLQELPDYFSELKSLEFLWIGDDDIYLPMATLASLVQDGCQIWF